MIAVARIVDDGDRALVKRLGFVDLSRLRLDGRQTGERKGNLVDGPRWLRVLQQGLVQDRQRAPEERFGLGQSALLPVQLAQPVERPGYVRVHCAVDLLADRQRAPEKRLG